MVNERALKGNWSKIKVQLRNRWGQLTSGDLQVARGNAEHLVGLIQRKTGETRGAIEGYLEELTSDDASRLSQVAETARDFRRQAMGRAYECSRQATDRLRHAFDHAADGLRRRYQGAMQMIRKRPAESLAVSLGIGAVAGVMLGLMRRCR